MKILLSLISMFVFELDCIAQSNSKIEKPLKLVSWSSEACDNTFDPYRLKTRISSIEYSDATTIITVNFSDNCCATFNPEIQVYKNKLFLLPYLTYLGDHCTCNCCFTIRYEISGLIDKKYKLYFKGKEIELSNNYYDTLKTSFQVYKVEKINRKNKFGFKEGKWISFYKNGQQKSISQYPDISLFYEGSPIWTKEYFASGKLLFYQRNDTIESWFEDGEMKAQFIDYKMGDTSFSIGFRKFDNRVLQSENFVKMYPTIFTSDFDANYKDTGGVSKTIYKREYFQNGKPKFIFGNDTSFSWFENGQLKQKRYENGSIEFDENGRITIQSFSWLEKGPEHYRNLENTLYVMYYPIGNINEMELVRDEPSNDGWYPNVRYTWKWDKDMNLTGNPEIWNEPLPWTRIKEIQLHQKMLLGIKNEIGK